jgi:hypothetical protein
MSRRDLGVLPGRQVEALLAVPREDDVVAHGVHEPHERLGGVAVVLDDQDPPSARTTSTSKSRTSSPVRAATCIGSSAGANSCPSCTFVRVAGRSGGGALGETLVPGGRP